jgi:vacuole morphology and inheritance protein 14
VAESAASYISILETIEKNLDLEFPSEAEATTTDLPTAFSLAKFIPLLQERIHVISPFTRTFLVSWLTLLDTIPDLELISYLPAFLAGLIKFLGDPNKDVYVATQGLLDRFLAEIRRIARIKKGIEESKKSRDSNVKRSGESEMESVATWRSAEAEESDNAIADSDSGVIEDDQSGTFDGDWVPGQDAQIDYTKILEILVRFVDTHNGTFRSLFYTHDQS